MRPSRIFEVFEDQNKLFTRNLVPGVRVYDELLRTEQGIEYREWSPMRSKLAACIMNGCGNIFFRKDSVVLYLGSSTGTTVSHVSDIASGGFVFAVDIAPRVMRELIFLAEKRPNIAPILADAAHPESFMARLSAVDILYQDIAQKDQVKIFLKNINAFLVPGGYAFLAVKARSIDVTRKPGAIFNEVKAVLEKELVIVDSRDLAPFQKDHKMFICKKK